MIAKFLFALSFSGCCVACVHPHAVADLFWPNTPAPWETIDAYHYPDPTYRERYFVKAGLATLEECRTWIPKAAPVLDAAPSPQPDYLCAVTPLGLRDGVMQYRLVLR